MFSNEPVQKVTEKATKNFIEKKAPKNYAEIEGNLWKNNITFTQRKHIDFLDVSNEDFSKYETTDLMGKKCAPSTFNIFRDSLSKNT